jgi:hypothetical protein
MLCPVFRPPVQVQDIGKLQHRGGLKANPGGSGTRVAPTRDLLTIAFIRAGVLLRRGVPAPGIFATHRPGALMDKSGRHFVARYSVQR